MGSGARKTRTPTLNECAVGSPVERGANIYGATIYRTKIAHHGYWQRADETHHELMPHNPWLCRTRSINQCNDIVTALFKHGTSDGLADVEPVRVTRTPHVAFVKSRTNSLGTWVTERKA